MIGWPVTDSRRVAMKLQAIDDQFDVCVCGLDRERFNQVMREAVAALGAGDAA
jgi:hypothetical protein